MPRNCAELAPCLTGCRVLERWPHVSPAMALRRAAGPMPVQGNTVELALVLTGAGGSLPQGCECGRVDIIHSSAQGWHRHWKAAHRVMCMEELALTLAGCSTPI